MADRRLIGFDSAKSGAKDVSVIARDFVFIDRDGKSHKILAGTRVSDNYEIILEDGQILNVARMINLPVEFVK